MVVIGGIVAAYWVADRTDGHLVSGGVERTYVLHVPSTYRASTPAPLVISLHGFTEWPAHLQQISRWDALSNEQGFIVVYPSGTRFPKRWRGNGSADAAGTAAEVQFINDLIDTLSREYAIDAKRIYVNGLSNGGGMAVVLGCQLAGRVAAIGSVAGAYAFPLSECQASRPVPAMIFHGTSDPIVPFRGGAAGPPGTTLPDVATWVADRAALNGCDGRPNESAAGADVTLRRYTGCRDDAEVAFYAIQGGGHTWPGGVPMPSWLTGPTSQQVDATREMWRFFQRFTTARP